MKRCYLEVEREVINNEIKSLDPTQAENFLSQYKMSSEMARMAIDRRLEINKFFITIFGATTAVLGGFVRFSSVDGFSMPISCLFLGLTGVFVAINWFMRISFLIHQSSIRQSVLEEFELYLPAFHWRSINARLYLDGGSSDKAIERTIPIVFLVASLAVAIIAFYQLSTQ